METNKIIELLAYTLPALITGGVAFYFFQTQIRPFYPRPSFFQCFRLILACTNAELSKAKKSKKLLHLPKQKSTPTPPFGLWKQSLAMRAQVPFLPQLLPFGIKMEESMSEVRLILDSWKVTPSGSFPMYP